MKVRRVIVALLPLGVSAAIWSTAAAALSPGDFDVTFGAGGTVTEQPGEGASPFSDIRALARQPNGGILIAGSAADINGRRAVLIARLNPDGSFDSTFGNGGSVVVQLGVGASPNSSADALAMQPDGRILVGGSATNSSGDFVFMVLRLGSDGSFDQSFGSGGKLITAQLDAGGTPDSNADALAVQSDGEILASGEATDSGSKDAFLVTRLHDDGSIDASFGTGGKLLTQLGTGTNPFSEAAAIALQADGKIVAVGDASDSSGRSQFLVMRLHAGGSPDAAFDMDGRVLTQPGAGPQPSSSLDSVVLAPDGKIIAGGHATDRNGEQASLVARLNTDGSFDAAFGTAGQAVVQPTAPGGSDPRSEVAALALQPNGKILAAGRIADNTGFALLVGRLNADGTLDSTFGSGGTVVIDAGGAAKLTALALQPDAKLLAGGDGSAGGDETLVTRLIADLPPLASFTASASRSPAGQTLSFDATGSSDPDGTITSYAWSFGDGGTASGANPMHIYPGAGTYPATLTVRDDYGLTASTTRTVVGTQPPASTRPPGGRAVAPAISALGIHPHAFRAAASGASLSRATGATVSYRDSIAATATLTVSRAVPGRVSGHRCVKPGRRNRHGTRCIRYARQRGSFNHDDLAGVNRLHFSGRLRGHTLPPGTYRLAVIARAVGRDGQAATTTFRIIR